MLGSTLFMGDTTNPNRPSIEVIENAIASPSQNSEPVSSNTQTITMDNVSVKNGMLVEKLKMDKALKRVEETAQVEVQQ